MEKNNVSTCGPSDGTDRNVNFQTRTSGVSQRKIEANRSNSCKSTGPKTVRGKNISKFNALKHGAYVKDLLISKHLKSHERFAKLADELQEEMAPGAYLEDKILVQQYVTAVARLDLLLEFELRGEDAAAAAVVLAQQYPHLPQLISGAIRGCERMYDRIQQLRRRVEETQAAELDADAPEDSAGAAEPKTHSDDNIGSARVCTTESNSGTASALATNAADNSAGPLTDRKVSPSTVGVEGASHNRVG